MKLVYIIYFSDFLYFSILVLDSFEYQMENILYFGFFINKYF